MAFQQTLSARVIVDLLSGSSAANVGAIGGSNQLLQQWNPFTLADTGPYTLPLPDDQQALGAFYLKNTSETQSVSVGWTPNGQSVAAVVTLPPGGFIIIAQPDPQTVEAGITAITLQADAPGATLSISAVAGPFTPAAEIELVIGSGSLANLAFLDDSFNPVRVTQIDFGDGTVVDNPTPTGLYFSHTYAAGTYFMKVVADPFTVLDIAQGPVTSIPFISAPAGVKILDIAGDGLTALPTFPAAMRTTLEQLQAYSNAFTTADLSSLAALHVAILQVCTSLVSVDLTSMVHATSIVEMSSCTSLTTVAMPPAAQITSAGFGDCALNVGSVNAILASLVAGAATGGTLDLPGGTNAAPTGQGILDVATLISRGWSVTTNFATLPITGVNQGTKTFTVAGNATSNFPVTSHFTVSGSTGNDGTYTVVSATFTSSTAIVVVESIPNATVDGDIIAL